MVGGEQELRHGIVLAKNYIAKAAGIKTGEAIWQAAQKCPGLIVLPPNYPLYLRYAKYARQIYSDYTDKIEPFGLDEAWIDVSGDNGEKVANEIRRRIKNELGVTASIGVSFNKIFAKLGSDMKKPDATTVINKEDYRQKVWPLPVQELLYVGSATKRKLNKIGVYTIGDLANTDISVLRAIFGKVGDVLYTFSNGLDDSPVTRMDEESQIKSIGNSTTTPRDLVCEQDVKVVLYVLCESVCARLREHGFMCRTVQIHVRDNELFVFERQAKLKQPTYVSSEVFDAAFSLFNENYDWNKPIRSLGVRGTDLLPISSPVQLCILDDNNRKNKLELMDKTVDSLRRRFGHFIIQRAAVMQDSLGAVNPKGDHIIHPIGFFKDGMVK